MANEKVFLPIAVLLLIILTIKGDCKTNKYTQTTYNFLDTNVVNLVSIKDAIDYVIQLSDGDVTKAERKFKKDIPIWKVDLITPCGGSIKIEMSSLDKSLVRIDADEGPFEYEIRPEESLISFKDAKQKAEEFSGQKTLKWNLLKNRNAWEYNFWLFTKSGKAQLRIDAVSGDILKSKKKK